MSRPRKKAAAAAAASYADRMEAEDDALMREFDAIARGSAPSMALQLSLGSEGSRGARTTTEKKQDNERPHEEEDEEKASGGTTRQSRIPRRARPESEPSGTFPNAHRTSSASLVVRADPSSNAQQGLCDREFGGLHFDMEFIEYGWRGWQEQNIRPMLIQLCAIENWIEGNPHMRVEFTEPDPEKTQRAG